VVAAPWKSDNTRIVLALFRSSASDRVGEGHFRSDADSSSPPFRRWYPITSSCLNTGGGKSDSSSISVSNCDADDAQYTDDCQRVLAALLRAGLLDWLVRAKPCAPRKSGVEARSVRDSSGLQGRKEMEMGVCDGGCV
jgi:hypothetical protein